MADLLTYEQAMAKLGIENKGTFRNLVSSGVLKPARVKIPGMRPMMREDVLDELINEFTLHPLEA
ncbi:MAG: helix-turn-helix domain-containing protein [Candidatus Glassbacteria bacterium]|nr:helix-turn-helix domain-containing protein [Candidatus Glassbacteria bacterium]